MSHWQNDNQQTLTKALKIIRAIPFTRGISLTGSQAERRATAKSDIDLFVQIEPDWIWSTRFFVTLIVHLAGIRRTNTDIAGKICLNWFATFNAPADQKDRLYLQLWQATNKEGGSLKPFMEKMISILQGKYVEKLLKYYQIKRIERDPRTHIIGSLVRHSDQELGFHPPKNR